MKPFPTPRRVLTIGAAVLVAGAAVVLARHARYSLPDGPHPAGASKAVYYCPMHPTYTSDRPGDCPICSMKLVKRETGEVGGEHSKLPGPTRTQAGTGETRNSKPGRPAAAKDICYLHNCAKAHEGKPCPMLVVAKEGEQVTCPICGRYIAAGAGAQATLKNVLYWTDPMIPGYKSDTPGKSPMGMELVPVYADAVAPTTENGPPGYAQVLVTPRKQQLIGITTAAVQRRALVKSIRAVGTVAHDPELYQAEAEYLQARRAAEQARQAATPDVVAQAEQLADAARVRLQHLGLSEELIEELGSRTEPERGLLVATPGEPVWVYAQAYEYELPLLKPGQRVSIEAPALGGGALSGTLRAVDPRVDPATRTTRVRVQVEDPEGRLAPEMYVTVSLAVDLGEVLAAPEAALFNTGMQHIVFVDKGQGLFEPRDVTVGQSADGYDEITAGLADGERVVTSGNFLIDSESRLQAALQGMTMSPTSLEEGDHHHGP